MAYLQAQATPSNNSLIQRNPKCKLNQLHRFGHIFNGFKSVIGLFTWGWGVGIVRFANDPCTGETGLIGTCYRRRQCQDLGGSASGSCASNIGVCCVGKYI